MPLPGFGSKQPEQPTGPSQLAMAKTEVAMYTDMFNRMTDMCFQKCSFKFKDSELNVGEMSCVDRCVGKYMESHTSVSEVMQRVQANLQASQQQQ